MPTLVGEKIAGSNYNIVDWLAIGASKRTTEILLLPITGNSTYKSGALKIAGGYVLGNYVHGGSGLIGKVPQYVAAGLVIDGVEDIMVNLLGANPLAQVMGQGIAADNSVTIV